jgi:hypothetical protein
MRRFLNFFAAITLIGALVIIGCSKAGQFDPIDPPVDGVDVTIPRVLLKNGKITMFVSVTDLKGNPIKQINESHLTIDVEHEGQVYDIGGFSLQSTPGTPTPIAAAVTMDYSGSMYFDTTFVPAMEDAVKTFISLKGLTDKVEIIKFDGVVHVVQPFTADTVLLYAAIDSTLSLGGSTAFYAACINGLINAEAEVATTPNVLPAVLGFTDGVNNQAPQNVDSVINTALQLQVPVYTLGFGGTATYMPDTATLRLLADTTGGRYYWTPDPTDLQQMYQYVNGQLSSAVVIGFPWSSKTNATIRVKVNYQGHKAQAEKMIWY